MRKLLSESTTGTQSGTTGTQSAEPELNQVQQARNPLKLNLNEHKLNGISYTDHNQVGSTGTQSGAVRT